MFKFKIEKYLKSYKKLYISLFEISLFKILLLLCLTASYANAQSSVEDITAQLKKSHKEDTLKVKLLRDLAWEYSYSNLDTSFILVNKALALSKKLKFRFGEAACLHEISWYYFLDSDFQKSMDYSERSLANFKRQSLSKDKKTKGRGLMGVANAYMNMGSILHAQGKDGLSITFFLKARKVYEQMKDEPKTCAVLMNIAIVYSDIGELKSAAKYFDESLILAEKMQDTSLIANNIVNSATIKVDLGESAEEMLKLFLRALPMAEKMQDLPLKAIILVNLATQYAQLNMLDTALNLNKQALDLNTKLNDKGGIAITYYGLGNIYLKFKKYKEAEVSFIKGYELAKEVGAVNRLASFQLHLIEVYKQTRQFGKALEASKLHLMLHDSVYNTENSKRQARAEMQYDLDKIHAADSVKTALRGEEERLAHKRTIQRQKLFTYVGLAGFLIMLVFAVIALRAFRNKQRSNKIIVMQKILVDEKQKEIVDSIMYAKRIQQALLPSERFINKNLKHLKKS